EVSSGDLVMRADLDGVEAAMSRLAEREDADTERHEGAIAARGMADAAKLLDRRWVLQVTNVPFQTEIGLIREFVDYLRQRFPLGRPNLATAMLERMLRGADRAGTVAVVSPQSWYY